MSYSKSDLFMMINSKFFESYQIPLVQKRIQDFSESQLNTAQSLPFKDPTTALIISVVGGTLGIDRFYIGDNGLGIAKLLTCGGLGIWAIVDLFLIMGATREKNLEMFNSIG